jgi:hypothetical protein
LAASVLYVNFRVYADLDRSLSSLDPYLSSSDEVIVVDNASEPEGLAWLTARHPRVRAVPSATNLGFAAGMNLAAQHASRPYLLLINPDAVAEGDVVRVLSDWLRDHPDTAVAGPRILDADGTVQASARRFPDLSTAIGGRSSWLTRRFPNNWLSRRNLVGRAATEPIDVDWLAGSCFMTTREAFDRAGGFDERFFLYWEDADYCWRLKRLGLKSTYVPTVSVRHAGGRSAALAPEHAIRAIHSSALHLHLKHGGWAARLTAPLATVAMRLRMAWRLRQVRRAAREHGVRRG